MQALGSPVLGKCSHSEVSSKKICVTGSSFYQICFVTFYLKSKEGKSPHVKATPMDLASKLEHDFRVIPDLHNPQPDLQCNPRALLSGGMVGQNILDLCHKI